MKKILLAFFSIFLISMLSAEGWQKNLEMGIAFPFGYFTGDGESVDDKETVFDMNYLAIREANKLAIKLNLGAGIGRSDKIDLDGQGAFRGSLSVGYAPILDEKFTLAIMGHIGFFVSDYEKKTKAAGIRTESSAHFRIGTIGADITGMYHFTKHLGFYTNLGFYMPFCGHLKTKAKSSPVSDYFNKTTLYDNKISLNGLIIAPAFGLTWRF